MGLLYVNPLVRVFEFFIGILACAVFMRVRASNFSRDSVGVYTLIELLVIALAVMSLWFTPRLTGFFGWQGPVADVVNYYLKNSGSFLPFAVLIVVFALGKGRVSRLLSVAPLIVLGEISFSLYLVHITILKWYENNLAYFSGIPNEL
jgi:peptidoglycan/LPS O-acetylase OafA/YrhL